MTRIRLLPLIRRANELLVEQGILEPETEQDVGDLVARTGNGGEKVRIIVGPEALYATCSLGRTTDLRIKPSDTREEVFALGQIAKSILIQSIRRKLAA